MEDEFIPGHLLLRNYEPIYMPSEFYSDNHALVGLLKPKVGTRTYKNLVKVLKTREIGRSSPYSNLTFGNKCRISKKFIPNKPIDLDFHDGKAFCGIFNRDGSRFLTASQDKYIRLYKSDDGSYKELIKIQAKDVGWSIIDVAFTPDQNYVGYSTWSSYVHIYPIDGDLSKVETCRLVDSGRRFCVFSLSFSSDSKEIIAACNDGCLYVYDRQQGKRVAKVRAHHYDANCVTFSDESSNIIYSGGDDGLVKVWDRRTLRENSATSVGTLAGHLDGVTFLDSRKDGRYLISNSKDQTIKLWDLRRFIKEEDVPVALRAVSMVNWDYRWQEVPRNLATSDNRYSMPSDSSVMTYQGHSVTKTLIRCRFSPAETTGQQFIYTGSGSGHIFVYDVLTGEKVHRHKAHMKCVRDMHWHPQRMEFVTTSWDHFVKRWVYCNEDKDNEDPKVIYSNLRRSLRLAIGSNRMES